MTVRLFSLICLLCCCILFGFCKKNPNDIRNNFKCKVNGKTWYPQESDFKLQAAEAHLTEDGKQLLVQAHNAKSREEIGFSVYDKNSKVKIGKYILNNNNTYSGYYDRRDFKGAYHTGPDYQGELEILGLDNVTKKIKGRFFFKCYNPTTNLSAEITKGEFNLAYSTY